LLAHSGGFVHVKLPEGTDPGSTNRRVLRKYVKEQAALQGVTVTFNRRICDAEHS
jgi:hypothetical protein